MEAGVSPEQTVKIVLIIVGTFLDETLQHFKVAAE
jgi:hypothetical protein